MLRNATRNNTFITVVYIVHCTVIKIVHCTVVNIVHCTVVYIVHCTVFNIVQAVAVYGITQLTEGLERKKLVGDFSYALPFFQSEDDFFRDNPYRLQVIGLQVLGLQVLGLKVIGL